MNYNSCPICYENLIKESTSSISRINFHNTRDKYVSNFCVAATKSDPLHYYNQVSFEDNVNKIIFQEFSINLGSKYILYANYIDMNNSKSYIKRNIDDKEFELPIQILPDFPDLVLFKKRIITTITFG